MKQRGRKSVAQLAITRDKCAQPRVVAAPSATIPPPPPAHFAPEEKAIWNTVVSEYRGSLTSWSVLETGLQSHARARQAEGILAVEGLIVSNRDGKPVAHPMIKVAHDARRQFQTTFRLLGIRL